MSTSHETICPSCDGVAQPLGKLGRLTWHRCRDCGQTFHETRGLQKSSLPGTFAQSAVLALREQAETLAALSIRHLTPDTRDRLRRNNLSVNAYPLGDGGFVYVGIPKYDIPLETDLARLFDLAEQAGVAWLKFDADAAIIDGVPLHGAAEVWS